MTESFKNVKSYINANREFCLFNDGTLDKGIEVKGIFNGERITNKWKGYFTDEGNQKYLIYPGGILEIFDNQ